MFRIVIEMNEERQVRLTAPDDKITVLGLLEIAKGICLNAQPQPKRGILLANGPLPPVAPEGN